MKGLQFFEIMIKTKIKISELFKSHIFRIVCNDFRSCMNVGFFSYEVNQKQH